MIGLAVAAAEQVVEHVVGQALHGRLAGKRVHLVRLSGILDDGIVENAEVSSRRDEAAAGVAIAVLVQAALDRRRSEDPGLPFDVGLTVLVDFEKRDDRGPLLTLDSNFVAEPNEHGLTSQP